MKHRKVPGFTALGYYPMFYYFQEEGGKTMLKSLLSAIRTVLVALARVLLCQYGVTV